MTEISGTITVLPDRTLQDVSVRFEDSKIAGVAPRSAKAEHFENSVILPGFIDLHTHGRLGQDTDDIDADLLLKYAQTGTTAFLPTFSEAKLPGFMSWLGKVESLKQSNLKGVAEILGAHIEGPFIDPKNKGGFRETDCLVPTPDIVQSFLSSSVFTYMTISPYVDGALDVIKKLSAAGTTCVSGHSTGSSELFDKAVDAGLKGICHFFNNNAQFSDVFKEAGVRKPTMDEAALLHDDIFLEIICDLQHVDPIFIKMALKLKGTGRIAAITDSISASGLSDGVYEYHDGRKYEIKNGGVHECETGMRFGSCVTQVEEFANLVEKISVSLHEAARMCALTPAEILGVDSRKGSLEEGKDADILVLDRDTYEIQAVFVKGVQVEL